jgi:hypothetical protein
MSESEKSLLEIIGLNEKSSNKASLLLKSMLAKSTTKISVPPYGVKYRDVFVVAYRNEKKTVKVLMKNEDGEFKLPSAKIEGDESNEETMFRIMRDQVKYNHIEQLEEMRDGLNQTMYIKDKQAIVFFIKLFDEMEFMTKVTNIMLYFF